MLQAGQWYAERTDDKERKKFSEEQKKKEKVDKTDQSVANVKRQTSGRESKKAK